MHARRKKLASKTYRQSLLKVCALSLLFNATIVSTVANDQTVKAFGAKVTIGYTSQGRPIVAYRRGSGKTVVFAVGAIHGNEAASSVQARYIKESKVPPDFTLWVIEVANPDGFASRPRIRQNANGVDLNRNFPGNWIAKQCPDRNCSGASPASESETVAMLNFFKKVNPAMVVFYHSKSVPSVIDANKEGVANYAKVLVYARVSKTMIRNVNCIGPCTGTATNFINSTIVGSTSFVVELTCDALYCLTSSVLNSHVKSFWAAAKA